MIFIRDKLFMICLPIFGNKLENILDKLKRANNLCDIIEIRLDLISDISSVSLNAIIDNSSLPLIATNRALWEGGSYKGPESERVGLLKRAIAAGFQYVDIEYNSKPELIEDIIEFSKKSGAKIILSYHDFNNTKEPKFYLDLFKGMLSFSPDIVKIVTMAKYEHDFLSLLPLYIDLKNFDVQLISFCMGEKGRYSRVFCLKLGAFLSFSCLDEEAASAPGQIPISEFKQILSLLK